MLAITNYTFPHEAEENLARLGHRTLRLPPHPNLPEPVASHPDMLLFFAPDVIFCTESYYKIATRELDEISLAYGAPIRYIDKECGNVYPNDVLLNTLPIGKYLICNTKTVADELLNLGLEVCHVNQGYTKCASLPLGEQAIITADPTVAKCAKERGIDVLQIQEGHISLPGYGHGFIGGCASFAPRADTSTVFFCGDVSTHPDAPKMKDFCKKHKFEVINLFQNPLCDTGTIFMI